MATKLKQIKLYGYRPSVFEQTKFDYSPLGKVFSKGSNDKHDKKEGLFKRLKNIEKNQNVNNNDKNKETNDKSELNSVKSKCLFSRCS